MALRQILYAGSAALPMTDDGLTELLRESRRNNEQHEVTGILFYVDRVFLQIIEGPDSSVDQLFGNIQQDDRIDSLVTILDRTIEHRAFPNWSMGFRSVALIEGDVEASFHNIRDRSDFDAIARIDEMVFSLIKGLFLSNAGRSF